MIEGVRSFDYYPAYCIGLIPFFAWDIKTSAVNDVRKDAIPVLEVHRVTPSNTLRRFGEQPKFQEEIQTLDVYA
jgi:hypothetical protein